MNWYEHLYVGEKAKERQYSILQGLREGEFQPEVYVIMPPAGGNNILEIVPSVLLTAPPYRDWDILIVGVAVTYWEALEVAGKIVDDMYQKTDGFCLQELMKVMAEVMDGPTGVPDRKTVRSKVC